MTGNGTGFALTKHLALSAALLAGACGGAPHTSDSMQLDEQQVLPVEEMPYDPVPVAMQQDVPIPDGHVRVGACSYRCDGGCVWPGLVMGWRMDTSAFVIPAGMTEEQADEIASGVTTVSGYACGVDLPMGTSLSVEARIRPGFGFAYWTSTPPTHPLGWAPCPCDGSTDPICEFEAEQSLYCGAVYHVAD